MAHRTTRDAYVKLIDRLNRFPQGAPPSKTLYAILRVLFSETEAELVSKLPLKPFTVDTAAAIWKMKSGSARGILDRLAEKALLVDMEKNGVQRYVLPPPMAGFIEFSMMRTRGDINQKHLAELLHQYINVESEFVRELFLTGDTQLGRVFVQEPMIPEEHALHVLDYEKATHVITTATHIGISMCYCRHKKMHLDMACNAPMDICMTFNSVAASLIKHGHVRQVDSRECLDLLDVAHEKNLVQFGENNREGVNFICNCCPCCCEAMVAARNFGFMNPVHTTHFAARLNTTDCNGCGKCQAVCPVNAFEVPETKNKKTRKAVFTPDSCLGCGVCARACPKEAISLVHRGKRIITPLSSAHRIIIMAIERGKLQELIFDNKLLWSHRMLGTFLGVILKLPPLKQVMANKQIQSRYLEAIIRNITYEPTNY